MKAKEMAINENFEYNILFSLVSSYSQTGDYFKNGYYVSNEFFSDEILTKAVL